MSINGIGSSGASDTSSNVEAQKEKLKRLLEQIVQLAKSDPASAAQLIDQLPPELQNAIMQKLQLEDPDAAKAIGKAQDGNSSTPSLGSSNGSPSSITADQLTQLIKQALQQQQLAGLSGGAGAAGGGAAPNATLVA